MLLRKLFLERQKGDFRTLRFGCQTYKRDKQNTALIKIVQMVNRINFKLLINK